jgi:hypothetical protein
MRRLAVVAAIFATVAVGSCTRNPGTTETTEDPTGTRNPSSSPAAGRRVEAEVVSTNPTAQMVTVRPTIADEAGSGAVETALPVQGEAAGLLGSLRSGDRVVLTCEAVAEPAPSAGAPARVSPEGLAGGTAVDAGVLGMPCPSVIRIEKVG